MIKRIAENIYTYKADIMGLSIIMIMIYHTILPENTPEMLKIVKRFGELGVDIFLFIGGFTVVGSLLRSNGVMHFYRKRFMRILPSYILIWGIIHLAFNIRYSESLIEYLMNLLLINCLVCNDLRNWFVAAVLIMYLITPFYVRLCQKSRFSMLLPVFIIIGGIFMMGKGTFKETYFFMFWLRLPIYLIGVNFYLLREKTYKIPIVFLIILCVLSLVMSQLVFDYKITCEPYEIRRYLYIPLVLFTVYFWQYKSNFLTFVGSITFELYLLHEFIQGLMYDLLSPPPYVYITVSVFSSVLIGYVIHHVVYRLTTKI